MMIKKEIMIELILKVIWTEMVAMSTVLTGVAYVDCTESEGERRIRSQFDRRATRCDRLRP